MKATFASDDGKHSFTVGDKEVIVGRGEAASARIDDLTLDRKHARVVCSGGECKIEDLGSASGLFVNDAHVTRTALKTGDRVQIGSVVFLVKIGEN